MFGIGTSEMMILFVIGLLLFGKNLPQIARGLGKGMMEFKKGLHGFEEELDSASRSSTTMQSRPLPREDRDEATTPKFEPPKVEPIEVSNENPAA